MFMSAKKRFQKLDEIVSEHQFVVDHAISQWYQNERKGMSCKTVVAVNPLHKDPLEEEVATRHIIFSGYVYLQRYDCISAKIPAYEAIRVKGRPDSRGASLRFSHYEKRPLREQEEAIQIQLLGPCGLVQRTDNSANYRTYFKNT